MKKTNFIIAMSIVVASLLYSCTSELETESQQLNSKQNSAQLASRESSCEFFTSAVESTIIPGVKAVNLDNGISTTCDNNILIFPTLQDYENSILKLDQMIEDHNDAFDQQTANMTDVEADDYADAIGFDEDQPLTDFEKELHFCSLRQHIIGLEVAWLDQQGDGAWNLNTSPDEYYIDDETERALLSLGSEFIVGDCKIGYTLYKMYDWGYVSFPITDIGTTTTVLTALNNITNPTQQPFNIGGATQAQVTDVLAPHEPINYTLTVTVPPIQSQPSSCKENAKEKGEEIFSSDRRIRWKNKFRRSQSLASGGVGVKIKSVTKSFRKKNGKWKRYRATIAAGMSGTVYANCYSDVAVNDEKERKRKRLKHMKVIPEQTSSQVHKLQPNKLFSIHKQSGNPYTKEIYQ